MRNWQWLNLTGHAYIDNCNVDHKRFDGVTTVCLVLLVFAFVNSLLNEKHVRRL